MASLWLTLVAAQHLCFARGRLSAYPGNSVGIGLPFALAEEVKKMYGNIMPAQEIKLNDKIIANGHIILFCKPDLNNKQI
jgi:hypothetical protein